MEITPVHDGNWLELRIQGRLDGYWSDHFANALDEYVRQGGHRIRLDLAEVVFLSSAGIRVLLRFYKQLRSIQGSLIVANPSEPVRKVLELSGLKMFLAVPADSPSHATNAARAVTKHGATMESESASFELFESNPGATLNCRVIGDPQLLTHGQYSAAHCRRMQFPESSMALGLGALGSNFSECQGRFGEFLTIAGAAAYQPTDGTNTPDYLVAKGSSVPEMEICYGIACDGQFQHSLRFEAKTDKRSVPLDELLTSALNVAEHDSIGLVMVAETSGLLGASVRCSPALAKDESNRLKYPTIREWLSFTAERAFARSLALVVGVAARTPIETLAPVVRPIGRQALPVGHVHAAAFSYQPLPRGQIDLKPTVARLFETQLLQGILHLLGDFRDIVGVGQSEFVRGVCWFGPIKNFAREND